jgi:hypothetical protein
MRFFLFLLIVAAVGAYFTNPTEADLRAQMGSILESYASKVEGAAPPQSSPENPAGAIIDAVKQAVLPAVTNSIGIERTDYRLFSTYKLKAAEGTDQAQMPGCLIGAYKMFIPLKSC